jgi:hypothetical protein
VPAIAGRELSARVFRQRRGAGARILGRQLAGALRFLRNAFGAYWSKLGLARVPVRRGHGRAGRIIDWVDAGLACQPGGPPDVPEAGRRRVERFLPTPVSQHSRSVSGCRFARPRSFWDSAPTTC